MPITPLHIGIPGLVGYYFHRHINITAAIIGSIIVDIEFLLFLLFRTPIHGIFHTFIGAAILSMMFVNVIRLKKKWFKKMEESLGFHSSFEFEPLAAGGFLGTCSHVLFDSMIYNDIQPLLPITENYLYLGGSTTVFILVYAVTALTMIALLLLFILKSGSQHPGPQVQDPRP